MSEEAHWMGRPISEFTREELIEVIHTMAERSDAERAEHERTLDVLLGRRAELRRVREGKHQCPLAWWGQRGEVVECSCGRRWRFVHPGNPNYAGWRMTLTTFLGLWRFHRGWAHEREGDT